jgi:hypothetical protein
MHRDRLLVCVIIEIDSHGGADVDVGLLGYNVMWTCYPFCSEGSI